MAMCTARCFRTAEWRQEYKWFLLQLCTTILMFRYLQQKQFCGFFLLLKYEHIRTLFHQGVTEENPFDILDHHPLQYYQYCKIIICTQSLASVGTCHMTRSLCLTCEGSRQKLINTCLGIYDILYYAQSLWYLWYR